MKRYAWLALFVIGPGAPLLPLACGGSVSTGGGGAAAAASSGAGGGASASSSSSSSGGCGDCMGFSCCGSACVNLNNDIKNCGKCGTVCQGQDPYCNEGTCGAAPACSGGATCMAGQHCCGTLCCNAGELCCNVPGPVGEVLQCAAPTPEGTCPKGCVQCKCASPDTPIATPRGDRPIAELAPGDLVYSVSARDRAIRAVPILRVNKVSVREHQVAHVVLETGAVLEISPRHPTGDGRMLGDLRPGDRLDGARVLEVRLVPYAYPDTYDILPASDTGTYFAAGVLLGSTLHGPVNAGRAAAE